MLESVARPIRQDVESERSLTAAGIAEDPAVCRKTYGMTRYWQGATELGAEAVLKARQPDMLVWAAELRAAGMIAIGGWSNNLEPCGREADA